MGSIKTVKIGGLSFGGGAPVRVESMLKSRLEDTENCLQELAALSAARCELVRVAFPDDSLAQNLGVLAQKAPIPIMADIHFDYKLALLAIDCGCPSIRINPGNMSNSRGLLEILAAAAANSVVIRIGSNGGSLDGRMLQETGGNRISAFVKSVEAQLLPLLERGFEEVIISAKSSSVTETVQANLLLSQKYPYPLHIGITEAGSGMDCAIKSASGLAILLSQGVGDTMRVSLTGESVEEIKIAYKIQNALGLREYGVNLISCPGCGRRRVDVAELAAKVKSLLPDNLPDGTTVAVMGCEVNGPKEAAAADLGIAGTAAGFVLFKKGRPVDKGSISELENSLQRNIKI